MMIIMGCILLFGCKKDDPKPPGAAVLSFPLQSSECTTGVDLNSTTSRVEFRWLQAKNTKTYELRVTNMLLNVTQTVSTQGLSAQLPLTKGTPYSWVVVTRNSETNQSATSAQWQFYNAGAQTSYAPFPAQLVAPQSGGTAVRDINNDVELAWTGADVDNDISGYEVYLSTFSPPVELIASPSANNTTVKGSTLPNTVYYWKIITRDSEGNSSDSGTFSFKAL
ncbi:MAG TPA: hypothetical protein VKN36_17385 [Eudoraea sp.]|nr:hypothetical protein [Eudoraea sp.]